MCGIILAILAFFTGSLVGFATLSSHPANELTFTGIKVIESTVTDVPFMGRDCNAPNYTANVPSQTNWVFEYSGVPITHDAQLITEEGGVWNFQIDQACNAQRNWSLSVELLESRAATARYHLLVAPYPNDRPFSGQTFRLIVDGVDTGAVVTIP